MIFQLQQLCHGTTGLCRIVLQTKIKIFYILKIKQVHYFQQRYSIKKSDLQIMLIHFGHYKQDTLALLAEASL